MVASLRERAEKLREELSFNPLHCGAVVASKALPVLETERAKFQSPSLRGSGRFRTTTTSRTSAALRFNPLHCGAVVASRARKSARGRRSRFQSPSLRGSGRFSSGWRWPGGPEHRVSIPFIAGQWSLRDDLAEARADAVAFQSPSLRGSGRFARREAEAKAEAAGFNPLHCGAVVASGAAPGAGASGDPVSIPFIAGQWSLPTACA